MTNNEKIHDKLKTHHYQAEKPTFMLIQYST